MESDEEEETLIMVELHGVIDSEIFAKDTFDKFKVLAIDSERPILQVENFVFSGEYEHTMGTAAFFEEDEKRLKSDPVFCKKPPRMLKYVCKTNKKLTMKRVFISEKQSKQDEAEQEKQGNPKQNEPGDLEHDITDDLEHEKMDDVEHEKIGDVEHEKTDNLEQEMADNLEQGKMGDLEKDKSVANEQEEVDDLEQNKQEKEVSRTEDNVNI